MSKLKLLCSYEEWKRKQQSGESISDIVGGINDTIRLITLASKKMPFGKPLSEEEELEYETLSAKLKDKNLDKLYTDATYEITDLYNELKNVHDTDKRNKIYSRIGRMQCKLEVMKEKYGVEI